MHFFKYIIFDLDDTLLDFTYAQEKAFFSLFASYNVEVSQQDFQDYKAYNTQLWKSLEKNLISKAEVKTRRFKKLIDKYEIQEDIHSFSHHYLEHIYHHCRVYPEALELCRELSKKYQLIAITNGVGWLQKKRFEKSGLKPFFQSLTISEECGVAKPNPEIFHLAMKKTTQNYDPKEILMVGDSLSSDIQGGINFGCYTCWFNPSNKKAQDYNYNYSISSLGQLIDNIHLS